MKGVAMSADDDEMEHEAYAGGLCFLQSHSGYFPPRFYRRIPGLYLNLEPLLEDMLPKKAPLIVAKCQNHINLVVVNNVPLFFNVRDGPYMPTLQLLHQYPGIMKMFWVDRRAIKFVLSGANIMCPGLTSAGGALDKEVPADVPVEKAHVPMICLFLDVAEGALTKE
ncbi:unnamed protein product [Sphagnum compactum]